MRDIRRSSRDQSKFPGVLLSSNADYPPPNAETTSVNRFTTYQSINSTREEADLSFLSPATASPSDRIRVAGP
ncbi:hypothetical protein P691DRAFT_805664 [Macrolepiota fuliginosa MF-IS2]|uniref:Uncharacterized protein n=1 Tax=Macrolepiota fuliginosa MF-IS2 TaxID=1400762 RepID=A0A9P5XM86_9AGAR|nr:hypothetical protein P691DRAFT_805664 [Macrolepiota fuliginosa MF-IS2]